MSGGPNERPSSILFVCGMNAIRSPMAAGLCKNLFPTKIYVQSAGVRTGDLDPFMVATMEEIGIDLSDHKSHTIEDLEDTNFDLVITLSPEAHHKMLQLTHTQALEVEYWPTADPTMARGSREQILSEYRQVRDGLSNRLKSRLNWSANPSV